MVSSFRLTRREEQVAELLAWGAAKKEVPDLLPIKPGKNPIAIRTVENTVRSIYEKLNIQKVNELSAWYFCTHFHISMDLSPLKRKVITSFMLAILICLEFALSTDFVRPATRVMRSVKSKTIRPRNRRDDTFFIEI
jgi:DNA-binding CsgD family transcriptional regulator